MFLFDWIQDPHCRKMPDPDPNKVPICGTEALDKTYEILFSSLFTLLDQ